jgi:hypothetical protein
MKDGRLHLRLNSGLLKRLKRMAKDLDKSISDLAVMQLEEMVEKYEEGKSLIKDAEQV